MDKIAKQIGASRTSVLGALRGLGTRYKEEESLEHFGLVTFEKKPVNQNFVLIYGLTALGIEEKELAENHWGNRKKNVSETVEPVTQEG